MHHFILVKIKADNRQDAFDEAKSQLETSIDSGTNTAGWDYLADDHAVVDKKYMIEHKHESFKELEKEWLSNTKVNIREHKGALKDIVFEGLVLRHLDASGVHPGSARAHRYLKYKDRFGRISPDIKAQVTKALKNERSKPRVPERLDMLAKEIVEFLSPQKNSMIEYHFRQLRKLYDCIDHPEPCNTLQCSDHHFADLGGDGKRTYYFIFDRHI